MAAFSRSGQGPVDHPIETNSNLDGRTDILIASLTHEMVAELCQPDGSYRRVAKTYPTRATVIDSAVAIGDLNCDGCPDAVGSVRDDEEQYGRAELVFRRAAAGAGAWLSSVVLAEVAWVLRGGARRALRFTVYLGADDQWRVRSAAEASGVAAREFLGDLHHDIPPRSRKASACSTLGSPWAAR